MPHVHKRRPRRWPEEWHLLISSTIAIALIFGAIYAAAWMGSGDASRRNIPTAQVGK